MGVCVSTLVAVTVQYSASQFAQERDDQKCVSVWPAACQCAGPAVLAHVGCARSLILALLTVTHLHVVTSPACSCGRHDPNRRLMVGLVGYPNVGKSSTINAIFGAKKTAVAPTPGKTKHFQTLNVSPTICLCDCPGEAQSFGTVM